jgi:outer membrane protein
MRHTALTLIPFAAFHAPGRAGKTRLLPGAVLGLLLCCTAPAAWSSDLLTVYKDAVANDAVYASARYALAAGQEKYPQGLATLLPTISGAASTQANDANIASRATGATPIPRFFNTSGYSITLSQPLFRWQNWQTYEQGKLLVAQSEAAFAQAGQDLIVRTAQAYFDVLAAADSLTVSTAAKTAISEQLAQAKRNFEVGTSTIVDTHEAQSRYDLAVAQEISARNDLETKRTALQQLVGKPVGDLFKLRGDVQIPPPQPAVLDKWVEASEANNYSVRAQDFAAAAAKRTIEIQRAGHYPTLDLTASRTLNSQTASTLAATGTDNTVNAIGVTLAIPLYSGGAVNSRVREAVANEEKAKADLENLKRTAAQNARQFYLAVTNGLAQVRAFEAAQVSSQSSLDSNKLGYEVGVRINIDVLNAQQQLYTTRASLSKARYDTIVNGFRLKAAAGSLKEEDVAAINALLAR